MNRFKGAPGFTIVELLIVVVVIAILAAITVVSYNGITSQARASVMASDIASWKKKSEIHKLKNDIVCPENYVFIYGNSVLGTSDFCVMKYEARSVGGLAVSRPEGTPWGSISQTSAKAVAAASCQGCRLPSDSEWMTIAADALSVKYNWTGGEVGRGALYIGHSDNSPSSTIPAGHDDSEGYYGTGNSETRGPGQRRTLYLSSGDVIWDFAGSIYELTSDVVTGYQPGLDTDSSNLSTYTSKQWTEPGLIWNSLPVSSRPGSLALVSGLAGIAGWGSQEGIGMLHSNKNQSGARVPVRGGNWGSGSVAGVLALALTVGPDNSGSSTGFRVAR